MASVQEGDSEDGLPSANAGRQTDADERYARALSFPLSLWLIQGKGSMENQLNQRTSPHATASLCHKFKIKGAF